MGVANTCNYTCYRQLYRLVPVLFTPVQLCTFLNLLEKIYMSSFTPFLLSLD